jgi:hypothetical protein
MSLRVGFTGACATFVGLLGIGCVTDSQLLQTNRQAAVQTAETRGRFELNCPAATATVLSQEVVQPVMEGPWVQGIPRAEYTIGVAGCNERKTFVVICAEGGDGCFATGPGRFTNE